MKLIKRLKMKLRGRRMWMVMVMGMTMLKRGTSNRKRITKIVKKTPLVKEMTLHEMKMPFLKKKMSFKTKAAINHHHLKNNNHHRPKDNSHPRPKRNKHHHHLKIFLLNQNNKQK